MKLHQNYIDVLEGKGWSVAGYTDDGRVELETYSPAGEDFCICVEVDGFPEAVAEYAAGFDPDEHIAMWIEAKKNGVRGIPETRELVHDAENIDRMLQELASALREADEATDLSDCDEDIKAAIIANAERLAEARPRTEKKNKPRLAEVLGVEVGQEFFVNDNIGKSGPFIVKREGVIVPVIRNLSLQFAINHPESIIRRKDY